MSTALQSIQEKIKADMANRAGAIPVVGGRRIGIKGKTFALPNGQSSPGPIECVVLDFRNHNKKYDAAYNPAKPTGPSCWSLGRNIKELAPPEDLEGRAADQCEGCTFNKFGSNPQGGKGKACKNTVRVAIMPTDATADDDAWIINVSPTSLKSWGSLLANLDATGMHETQVVTQISFNQDEAYPQLVFKAVRQFEDVETAWLLREKAQALLNAAPASDD